MHKLAKLWHYPIHINIHCTHHQSWKEAAKTRNDKQKTNIRKAQPAAPLAHLLVTTNVHKAIKTIIKNSHKKLC